MSMDTKYKIEEASIGNLFVSNFVDFKMTTDISVLAQAYKLLLIVGDMKIASIELP